MLKKKGIGDWLMVNRDWGIVNGAWWNDIYNEG